MNVTNENFEEALKHLQEHLPTAEFVAFDEEMTGITLPAQPEKIEDVPAQRYLKMRNVATKYNIIQFGVCLFHAKDILDDSSGYVARPYNFYLFPESGLVTMEGSSIGFLRQHNMDFNKWIYEGIPYHNRASAEKLHASMFPKEEVGKSDAQKSRIVLTKNSDIEDTNKGIEGLKTWLEDESKKEETEYTVMTANPYLRRFLYETVAAQFPDLLAESRPVPNVRGQSEFVVLRLNESQRAEREDRIRAEKEKSYAQKVGLFRLYDALVEAKKPLVGHNCMYDILFMMSHFEGPLPTSYACFKELFHKLFPVMLDTKALVAREPFKYVPQELQKQTEKQQRFGSTALGEIYKVFLDETKEAQKAGASFVDVAFAEKFDRYVGETSHAHEAAYDAYMTGFAFAQMAKRALSTEGIAAFGSRTPMFRALFDFNLAGEDTRLHEGVYVHVSGLKGRSAEDLRKAFAEIKVPEAPTESAQVQIRWIDDDNAFAVLPEACAAEVSAMLERGASVGGLQYTSWEEWSAAQTAKANGDGDAAVSTDRSAKRQRTS